MGRMGGRACRAYSELRYALECRGVRDIWVIGDGWRWGNMGELGVLDPLPATRYLVL